MPSETREEMLARFPDNAIGAIDADDTRALVNAVYDIGEEPSTAITYEGDHVPATTYEDGDIVLVNGVAYMCVGGPTTAAPDPAPWDAVGIPLPPPSPTYGTTLPVSPVDGQEAILVDSLTVPTFQWRFRYNAQASGGFKWEFIGGVPAFAGPMGYTAGVVQSHGWLNLAGGPNLALPRAGEYLLEWSLLSVGGITYSGAYSMFARSNGSVSGGGGQRNVGQGVAQWAGSRAAITEKRTLAVETINIQISTNHATSTTDFNEAALTIIPVRIA